MILAIDIGGTRFRVAVADDAGRLVRVARRSTKVAGGSEWMIEQVTRIASDFCDAFPIHASGIGFGGPVDFDRQRIINSTHVAGWDDVALPEILQAEIGVPAIVDNDANVGAMGELVYGAGRGLKSLVYYTVSTGIGGGIVLDGDVYRGANGNAGELGHVPILRDRPRCACGNVGCLESLCSGPAIATRGRTRMKRAGLTAKDVFDCARNGDPVALKVVEETADYLGMAIAAIVNTIAPELVVVGGGVAKAGRILFERLRSSVKRRVMPVHRDDVRVVAARRGDNAVLLGAVAMARRL